VKRWVPPLYLIGTILLAVVPLVVGSSFFLNALILAFLFGAMAQGWNLLGGYAGQISFGHAVFFGIGAYAAATLLGRYQISPWAGMWAGAAISLLVSLAIGYPTFRLRRHFFALATLALGEIARISVLNWPFVGAAIGLYLPLQYRNQLAYLMWETKTPYYFTALAVLITATVLVGTIDRHRAGTYLRAINQDEAAAEMLGIPTRRYKLYAMALSAILASLCGTVYALYVLYIDPYNVMTSRISLLVVVIALIGGRGTVWGPVLGALFIVLLNEYTRSWLGAAGSGADYILFGLLIMLVAIREPRGLVGLLQRGVRTPMAAIEGSAIDRVDAQSGDIHPGLTVLNIGNVRKRFGGVQAIRQATLQVGRGEIVGLIGPNGAGKTTLFDCMTGFLSPDDGTVHVGNRSVLRLPPHRIAWMGLGRTFQAIRIFPQMTVWDNMICAAEHLSESLWETTLHGPSTEVQARGRHLLDSFQLWGLRELLAGALSYGQQKLLSLAMAVLRRPAVVLLDEPTAGVNPVLVNEIGDHIRSLNGSGITFLVIEHNMEFIMALAHRIAFMAEGQIVAIGPPADIQRNQTVLELYYGR
jgi:branched-chain amino acid transport system permease protein